METAPHMRAVVAPPVEDTPDTAFYPADHPAEDGAWEEAPLAGETGRGWATAVAAAAVVLTAAWTGVFALGNPALLGGSAGLARWSEAIAQWAGPTLLITALALLLLRRPSREARRFGEVATSLRAESVALEQRLSAINGELSLAREFLAAQTRDLDHLGRQASERIGQHAAGLQALIRDNGQQVEAIAAVSHAAHENMARLRADLPVVGTAARDVSNQIASAGRAAQDHIEALMARFGEIATSGADSARSVQDLTDRVAGAVQHFAAEAQAMQDAADRRFAALYAAGEEFRTRLDQDEAAALDGIRARAEALKVAISDARGAADSEYAAAADALDARTAALREGAAAAAAELRAGEAEALTRWHAQIDDMQQRLELALTEIATRDTQALDAARKKLDALTLEAEQVDARLAERNAAFDADLTRRRAALEAEENASADRLAARFAAIDDGIAARSAARDAALEAVEAASARIAEGVADVTERFHAIAATGDTTRDNLANAAANLAAALERAQAAAESAQPALTALVADGDRLQAALGESRTSLALGLSADLIAAEGRLAGLTGAADTLAQRIAAAGTGGESLAATLRDRGDDAARVGAEIAALEARLSATLAAHDQAIAGLEGNLARFDSAHAAVALRAQGTLERSLGALRTAVEGAVDDLATRHSGRITALSRDIAAHSAPAVAEAVAAAARDALASLAHQSEDALAAANQAADGLAREIAALRAVPAGAPTAAAGQAAPLPSPTPADSDFARRMGIIVESLHSNAIDIAKSLSTEVTDLAWEQYLRGDRGIFTRRAVKLVSNGEARAIAELYNSDREFRDHVSRYIRDFEAMLSGVLAADGGHAMSVALLSGEMGKLYVLLAKALERIRQ